MAYFSKIQEEAGREEVRKKLGLKKKEGEKEGIAITHVLTGISTCHFCGGVVFGFREQVLWFSQMTKEDREKMRERVKDGFQLEDLKREFASEFYEDEWDSWECEKCGDEGSYPLKGGR